MGLVTALWLAPFVAFVTVCTTLILLYRRAMGTTRSPESRYCQSVLVLGGVVTVIRVWICWHLTHRALLHSESLNEIPLIALLMPEYLLSPGDPATPAGMWSLTAALVIGSLAGVWLLALIVWKYGGWERGEHGDGNGNEI